MLTLAANVIHQCWKVVAFTVITTFVAGTLVQINSAAYGNNLVWDDVKRKARGQTVYWNAWGGKAEINDFIAWVGEIALSKYDVTIKHVKIDSTAAAVGRVASEKIAGRTTGGSIDLIWANGENFATLKQQGLLFGPWTHTLPNYQLVATDKPTNTVDFGEPVDHMEAPYGMAQLTFAFNPRRKTIPPKNAKELLNWAQESPGRLTYPTPENWIGNTFLKQILMELATDRSILFKPVESIDFDRQTVRLWQYLDKLHPALWRNGTEFPADEVQQRTMLADGELDFNITFGPAETSSAIEQSILPPHIRTFVFESGTIGNTHFVSIPFNAKAKEGAMVVANIILSAKAQAHKQNPAVWGDMTVLDVTKLSGQQSKLFADLPIGVATLSLEQLGTPLPEPHYSWGPALTKAWLERYRGS